MNCGVCFKPLHADTVNGLCAEHYREKMGAKKRKAIVLGYKGLTIPEIMKATGLSRNRVATVLREEGIVFVYARKRIEDILTVVSETFCVPEAAIKGLSRARRVYRARAAFCLLAVDYKYSLSAIGRVIGRDHSTCLHASRRAAQMLCEESFARMDTKMRRLIDDAKPFIRERMEGKPIVIKMRKAAPVKPAQEFSEAYGYVNGSMVDMGKCNRAFLAAMRNAHPGRVAA